LTDGNSAELSEETMNVRFAQRVMIDAPSEWSNVFNERVKEFLPQTIELYGETWDLRQDPVNPRWRIGKYDQGNYFKPHFDAGYTKSPTEKTCLTLIFYLNEDFEGGELIFFPGGKTSSGLKEPDTKEVVMKPKTGVAAYFFQTGPLNFRHEGALLTKENKSKYILRTDVFYVLKPKTEEEEKSYCNIS
jgi:prolyl 4-hydroxylase